MTSPRHSSGSSRQSRSTGSSAPAGRSSRGCPALTAAPARTTRTMPSSPRPAAPHLPGPSPSGPRRTGSSPASPPRRYASAHRHTVTGPAPNAAATCCCVAAFSSPAVPRPAAGPPHLRPPLRLQAGPDPHRQPGGAVRANDRDQRLHGRQPHRIRRRAPPARCTAVGPSGGARADARGTAARPRPSCGAGRGRSRRRQRTRDRLRRIVAGPGPGAGRKSRLVAGLAAVLPLAGWSSRVGGLWPAAHAGGRGQGAGRLPARHALHQALRCPEGGRRDRCHAGTGGGRRHRPATTARRALARS